MSTDQHINESILNDEIREHQKENRTRPHGLSAGYGEYPVLRCWIRFLQETAAYDYDAFTADDVRHALRQERKSLRDFQALLSPGGRIFPGRDRTAGPGGDAEIFWGIPSACLLPYILQIIVKTTAFTAASTATTTSAEPSSIQKKSAGSLRPLPGLGFRRS